MEITLYVVGKTTVSYVQAGIDDYLARLRHYLPVSVSALPDLKGKGKMDEKRQKDGEGERILAALRPGDYVVLLDEHGREYDSDQFAAFVQKQMASGLKRLVFVVGGPYGFSPSVYDRADSKLSMSRMTLSHEMIRMFFIEQVYRAMTILRGEPYHHR